MVVYVLAQPYGHILEVLSRQMCQREMLLLSRHKQINCFDDFDLEAGAPGQAGNVAVSFENFAAS